MAFRKSSLEKIPFRYKFLEDYYVGKRLRRTKIMKFRDNLVMPISSRRFETAYGFYKVCLADYVCYIVKAELSGKKSAGYYAKTKSPKFYYILKKLYPNLLH